MSRRPPRDADLEITLDQINETARRLNAAADRINERSERTAALVVQVEALEKRVDTLGRIVSDGNGQSLQSRQQAGDVRLAGLEGRLQEAAKDIDQLRADLYHFIEAERLRREAERAKQLEEARLQSEKEKAEQQAAAAERARRRRETTFQVIGYLLTFVSLIFAAIAMAKG